MATPNGGSHAGPSLLVGDTAAAHRVARSGTPPPQPHLATDHHAPVVLNGHGNVRSSPMFKNPLDRWGSPSPPPKRHKTEDGLDAPWRSSIGSGSRDGPQPNGISRSQPMPKTTSSALTASPSFKPRPYPWATPQPRRSRPAQRPVPAGFRATLDGDKVVLVLNDDDDEDDLGSTPSRPNPSPRTLVKPPLAKPLAPFTPPSIGATAFPSANGHRPSTDAALAAQDEAHLAQSAPAGRQLPNSGVPAPVAPSPSQIPHTATQRDHPMEDASVPIPFFNDDDIEDFDAAAAKPQVRPNSPAQQSAATPLWPLLSRPTPRRQARRHTRQTQRMDYMRFSSTPARRPYLHSAHREFVSQNYHGLQRFLQLPQGTSNAVIHVDFFPEEVQYLVDYLQGALSFSSSQVQKSKPTSAVKELKSLLRGRPVDVFRDVFGNIEKDRLPGRNAEDIFAFIVDIYGQKNRGRAAKASAALSALILRRHDHESYSRQEEQARRAAKLQALLLKREAYGHRIVSGRSPRLPINFGNELQKFREDGLRLRNEWTNCAGDVTTISWTSGEAFICGTTTHMDDRNHEYNRQGNLALASVSSGTLRAYHDHRIVRPRRRDRPQQTIPSQARASLDDPWLYTSVVSSDYDPAHRLAFTSGFDKTAKVWDVSQQGNAMSLLSTWHHDGKVNFVVASSHPIGLVATATDVPHDTVRVYRLSSPNGDHRFRFKTYSCSRIVDLEGRPIKSDKWAYLPAAVRWGLTNTTNHLLLVGFSPRSLLLNGDDEDIPYERRDSGELCLFDGLTGDNWRILGGTSQNVFEVAWHPTQPCFAAATAPNYHNVEDNVRTQIRIFRPSENKEYGGRAFSEVQVLDCFADDINELALLPNSFTFLFIAAGCTNGRTYVWDTSQGDHPVHILAHGACIEELSGEVISVEDTGVKFVEWGSTPDRLYTGSSDGKVIVWNIRTHRTSTVSPFVRSVLQCPGPVAFGAFSPDKSKLAIGDASGRVFLLAVEDSMTEDDEDGAFLSDTDDDDDDVGSPDRRDIRRGAHNRSLPKRMQRERAPELIRHPSPPPPMQPIEQQRQADGSVPMSDGDDAVSGVALARSYLKSGQLVIVPDQTVGAVKGPNYADTKLFCLDCHYGRQPGNPLLAQFERLQQESRPRAHNSPSRQTPLRSIFDSGSGLHRIGANGMPPANENGADLDAQQQQQQQQRARAVTNHVQALHKANVACDLDIDSLPAETRQELELADWATLLHLDDSVDYGFVYEEMPDDF